MPVSPVKRKNTGYGVLGGECPPSKIAKVSRIASLFNAVSYGDVQDFIGIATNPAVENQRKRDDKLNRALVHELLELFLNSNNIKFSAIRELMQWKIKPAPKQNILEEHLKVLVSLDFIGNPESDPKLYHCGLYPKKEIKELIAKIGEEKDKSCYELLACFSENTHRKKADKLSAELQKIDPLEYTHLKSKSPADWALESIAHEKQYDFKQADLSCRNSALEQENANLRQFNQIYLEQIESLKAQLNTPQYPIQQPKSEEWLLKQQLASLQGQLWEMQNALNNNTQVVTQLTREKETLMAEKERLDDTLGLLLEDAESNHHGLSV